MVPGATRYEAVRAPTRFHANPRTTKGCKSFELSTVSEREKASLPLVELHPRFSRDRLLDTWYQTRIFAEVLNGQEPNDNADIRHT